MKPMQLTIAAFTSLFLSSVLWSCNNDRAPSELAGTRSARAQQEPPTMPSGTPGKGRGMMDPLRVGCPMAVQGADVSVVDTDGGVAITFTTDAGDVADLRTRVRNMAKMYDVHGRQGGMMWYHMGGVGKGHGGRGMGGEGMGPMAGRGLTPAAGGAVSDTAKGARIELRPTDPSQLDAIREHARWHQNRMQAGECWMPQGQTTKAPQGEEG